MSAPVDPRWPKLLSLAVHEFRTPITVVAGYIRMLLKDRAGAVTDQQRRLLEEAEKSCGRLSALVAEMSELSALEAGTATFNRSAIDLRDVLRDTVAALPPLPDREIGTTVSTGDGPAMLQGDPVRLKAAFASLVHGLRRELIDAPQFVVREAGRTIDGRPVSWITLGSDEEAARLQDVDPGTLTTFDEWRGGSGLSLALARRILAAHGGSLWSPADGAKASAVVSLPHA
jgi:two-component system, OmpR family, sensor kinase